MAISNYESALPITAAYPEIATWTQPKVSSIYGPYPGATAVWLPIHDTEAMEGPWVPPRWPSGMVPGEYYGPRVSPQNAGYNSSYHTPTVGEWNPWDVRMWLADTLKERMEPPPLDIPYWVQQLSGGLPSYAEPVPQDYLNQTKEGIERLRQQAIASVPRLQSGQVLGDGGSNLIPFINQMFHAAEFYAPEAGSRRTAAQETDFGHVFKNLMAASGLTNRSENWGEIAPIITQMVGPHSLGGQPSLRPPAEWTVKPLRL